MVLPAALMLILMQVLALPPQPLATAANDAAANAAASSEAAPASAATDTRDTMDTTTSPTETNGAETTIVAAAVAVADTATDETAPNASSYMPGNLMLTPTPSSTDDESSSLAPAAEPAGMILNSEADAKHREWLRRQKRIWLTLSIAQSSAAMLDAVSTRMVVGSGRGQETNPLLKPFAGNGSMYAAIQVAPLILDYLGHRMLTSRYSVLRRTWFVPQAVGTVVSLTSGAGNLAVYAAH